MTSQTRLYTITIHVLPNISRSKGSQTMRYGQLVEYNNKNIFLERSFTKCGGEISSRPFFKKPKFERISGSTV